MLVMRGVCTSKKGKENQKRHEKEERNLPPGAICGFCFAYIHVCSQCKRDAMRVLPSTVSCVQRVWTDNDKEVKRSSYFRVITHHMAQPAAFFFDLTFWATTSGSCESSSGIIPKFEGLASGIFIAGSSSTVSEPRSSASFGSST